jgi:large repetitive protein
VGLYPTMTLGPDTLFCSGDSVLLRGSAASFFATSWSTGATSDSIYVSTPGTYWLDVKNIFACTTSDTIVVQEVVLPALQFPDTAACVGSLVTAYNPFPAYPCLWANGTVGDSATFVSGSTVWGELSQGFCTVRDSFVIALLTPPYVNFGADTVLCLGADLLLDPTDDPGTYQWAGGQTDSTLMVTVAGTYSVSVTDLNGCVGVDQIDVTYEAPVSLYVGTTQTSFCASDPALVLLPSPSGGVLSGDVSGNAIDPAQLTPGNHMVLYHYTSPAGCADSVALVFFIAPGPTPAQAGVDQTLLEGSPVQLAANLPLAGAGMWSSPVAATFGDPSEPATTVSGLPLGTSVLIWTISTPLCGSSSDTVRITLNPVVAMLIPTGFSPNNDGYNDTWEVAGLEMYTQRQLKIFNRWGAAVYENAAWANGWDARNDGGVELPDDTYYYVLDLGTAQHAGYLVIKR